MTVPRHACPASAGNGEERSAVKLTEGTHEKSTHAFYNRNGADGVVGENELREHEFDESSGHTYHEITGTLQDLCRAHTSDSSPSTNSPSIVNGGLTRAFPNSLLRGVIPTCSLSPNLCTKSAQANRVLAVEDFSIR